MSNKKISQLTATTDLVNADEFVVVDGGTTKKITFQNLQKQVLGYTSYAARLNATGTNNPTVVVISNNTGSTISWSHSSTGIYEATISGLELEEDKAWFTASGGGENTVQNISWGSENTLTLDNYNITNGQKQNGLNQVYVEIRNYN